MNTYTLLNSNINPDNACIINMSTYSIIVGAVANKMYYATSNNYIAVTWSHTCYNCGAIVITLGSYYFALVCGGNDGDKSAPINNIYVL